MPTAPSAKSSRSKPKTAKPACSRLQAAKGISAKLQREVIMAVQGDLPVSVKIAAIIAGVAEQTFWRQVQNERLPRPAYPAPRAPRWIPSEIRAALSATRAWPVEAKAERRAAKLAAAE